jgi:hypothetical protein
VAERNHYRTFDRDVQADPGRDRHGTDKNGKTQSGRNGIVPEPARNLAVNPITTG